MGMAMAQASQRLKKETETIDVAIAAADRAREAGRHALGEEAHLLAAVAQYEPCHGAVCGCEKSWSRSLAQLKLAFDNLDKLRPGVSREVVTQMFELVVNSKNPAVNSLMPPTVAALASLSLHDQQQQAAAIATPGLAPHHHRAAPPDGHPPPA